MTGYNRRSKNINPLSVLSSNILREKEPVRLEITLTHMKDGLSLSLRAGQDRLYVVRQMLRFLRDWHQKAPTVFSNRFTLEPSRMGFDEKIEQLLDYLYTLYCEKETPDHPPVRGGKTLALDRYAHLVLEKLEPLPFLLEIGENTTPQEGISEEELPILCSLSGTLQELSAVIRVPGPLFRLTEDFRYVAFRGQVIRVNSNQRQLLAAIRRDLRGGEVTYSFAGPDTAVFLNETLPALYEAMAVAIQGDLEDRLVRLPLRITVYLDKIGRDVSARVLFCYGSYEINPFSREIPSGIFLYRDAAREGEVMHVLSNAGFHVREDIAVLHGTEAIYRFITEGTQKLSTYAEVFFSNEFKQMDPRKPHLTARMNVRGSGIVLTLLDGDTEIEELRPILRALQEKRDYFRFRDGTFLDLRGLDEWQSLAQAVSEADEEPHRQDDPEVRPLAMYRAAYLNALVEKNHLPVSVSEEVTQAASLQAAIPKLRLSSLRPYQVRGYNWIMTLDALHMGGVLADDMGLGKTIQTIAAVERVHDLPDRLPSLIVAPRSLMYNWVNEFSRFAPQLSVTLVQGSQPEREVLLSQAAADPPDALITSYPLIRRVIDQLSRIPFHFVILDEAQQIKNAQSVAARAVKKLQARTRLALTGTPMENHAGELWSLMDFCLPGYLPSYPRFLKRYQDGNSWDDLRTRVRPFLMRRLREDVLDELPPLMEHTMYCELTEEQKKVYDAVLYQCRTRVDDILRSQGMNRGRTQILSAIMQLRQVCCHPSLCMEGYLGGSGKEDMLMDLVPQAIQQNRRILLFSQFTTMLRLLEKRLRREGIETLYLDGHTPTKERQDLTERFNAGQGSIFLISLKAGGTGLNLTGADMVIHYDPWWNPAAQDQATARAHRIGQTRPVNVFSLVTHNTIEEQVVRMSENKRQLFDQLITAGEMLPTQLTDEDILSLFDE